MMVQVEGADRVARNLYNYAQQLMPKIDNDIYFVGESAKQLLQLKFPDLKIEGNFYPDEHTYVLSVTVSGQEFGWIWCPQWHRYFKRERDQTETGQEMRSNIPDIFDEINKLLDSLWAELEPKMSQSIKYLK